MLAKKQQPPSLTEKIRAAAEKVRQTDSEVKDVIDLYLDEQKQSAAGAPLPRETLRQLLMGKYDQLWHAILGLEQERANEPV